MAILAVAHLTIEHLGSCKEHVGRSIDHAVAREDDFVAGNGRVTGSVGAMKVLDSGSGIGGPPYQITVTPGTAEERADVAARAWSAPVLKLGKVSCIAWGRPEEGANG